MNKTVKYVMIGGVVVVVAMMVKGLVGTAITVATAAAVGYGAYWAVGKYKKMKSQDYKASQAVQSSGPVVASVAARQSNRKLSDEESREREFLFSSGKHQE